MNQLTDSEQEYLERVMYVKARNKLIPAALKYTRGIVGKRPAPYSSEHIEWGEQFNRLFHGKMHELAQAAGLVK